MSSLGTSWSILLFVALLGLVTSGIALRLKRKRGQVMEPSTLDRLKHIPGTLGFNALNSLVYLLSGGRHVLHDGRFRRRGRRWVNWNRTILCSPNEVHRPRDEQELRQCIRAARKVRVIGSGHSFNASATTQETLVSLTEYRLANGKQLEWLDAERGIARVATGLRLRDLMRELRAAGQALPVLGSADAQSIGGLLATDVHGTGREHGFLSEQVLALKLMDSQGQVRLYRRDSSDPDEPDTFRAALGGLGACGIVTEVDLQCVPHFNLEKSSRLMRRPEATRRLQELQQEYDHLSIYEAGGVQLEHVRVNTWKRTHERTSALLPLRRMLNELLDMLASGFLFEFAFASIADRKPITLGVLGLFKLLMHGKRNVHPAATGFSRTLYYQHDELEFGVPSSTWPQCLEEIRRLLLEEKFMTIMEVRFTPPSRTPAFLGPGAGDQQTCFIELAPTLSYSREELSRIFTRVTDICLRHGGRAHLGKQVPGVTPDQMRRMHGERFERFQRVRQRQDPDRKFTNDFTARVLGP